MFGNGRRQDLEDELQALRIVVAGAREENDKLHRQSEALRAEVRRLTAAVEASNAELRRLLWSEPAAVVRPRRGVGRRP